MPAPLVTLFVLVSAVTVEGVVERQDARWEGGEIVTRSTVRVDRVLAGEAPARVVVVHRGGAIDGIGQRVSGEVTLATGEAVTLDLEPGDGGWRVAGGADGKRGPGGTVPFVRTTTLSSNPPCSGGQDHPLYWNRLGLPLTLDAAFTREVMPDLAKAALDASIATWNAPSCSYLELTDAGTAVGPSIGYVREGVNRNVIAWQETWTQNPRAIAVTLTTFECDTGKLLDADIVFNGQGFIFTVDPSVRPGIDIQNTATHELGHLLGFDHSADPASTMFADAPPSEISKRDLTDDDILGLCTVYARGDEPDDPDDAPPGGCGCGAGRDGALGGVLPALMVLGLRRRRRR